MPLTRIFRGLLLALALTGAAKAEPFCAVHAEKPAAAPERQITTLDDITATATELTDRFGAEHVLIVFDIDNTLLTSVADFGSDAWFEWQEGLMGRPECAYLRVGDDFPDLLSVQYVAYSAGEMRLTEQGTAALVDRLVEAGHPVMALTARGPEARGATMRELEDNGIGFSSAPACRASAPENPSLCLPGGAITPQSLEAAGVAMLSPEERTGLDLSREASYGQGVMMVSGQNKGLMLRLLLASSEAPIKAVIFVDDGAKNVSKMTAAFTGDKPLPVRAFWYTAFEESDEAFLNDPQRLDQAWRAWRDLSGVLCRSMGSYCGP
jgi:hypothetical protein